MLYGRSTIVATGCAGLNFWLLVMRLFLRIVILVVCCFAGSPAWGDMIDRLRPEKLRAVHEAIENLKTRRRQVRLASNYQDVRTLLHVHSAFSHDSRGTIEEIVAAAKETGVRVIMFSEHPASGYDYFLDGHRGVKDGVMLIPAPKRADSWPFPGKASRI